MRGLIPLPRHGALEKAACTVGHGGGLVAQKAVPCAVQPVQLESRENSAKG